MPVPRSPGGWAQRLPLPALRQRIGRHVLVSLVLIWGLGSAVILAVGNHFVVEAFDRALLDDAHGLAAHVRGGVGGVPLELGLTQREVGILLLDQSVAAPFAVYGPDGALVAGDSELAADALPKGRSQVFSTMERDGREWRRVTLLVAGPPSFTVVMAEATESRTQLLHRLLIYSGLAQLWLLVVLGSRLLGGIEKHLRPLAALQAAVQLRDAADLQPLPAMLTEQATTLDVQRLGEALDGLLARVREGLHAQREFAGNVAHELRTPLAGIRAQAAHALAQNDPAVWRSELEGIAQAEQRASRTVDQLLALARAAEGGIALSVQTVALDAVVRDVVLRCLPRADALGVDLGAQGLEPGIQVRGNTGLIEGILHNLLDNALRYGRGHPPQITVALHCEPPYAVLQVLDNGPGVDAELARHVQQRWAQGAPGLVLGQGAGLGLSIVARYAQLMGGRLALEGAAHGPGLVASVWLPLADPAAP